MVARGTRDGTEIGPDEGDERDLKKAAKLTLGFTEAEIDKLVSLGTLVEVSCDGEQDL